MKNNVLGDKYRLEKIIGKGGSGCVYLAMDYALGKKWAIKELSKNEALILDEVEMLRTLEHPMLPRIVDRIETTDKVYLVMDYLNGVNLQSILRAGNRFSVSQVLHLGLQLCDVLGYLHTHEPSVIYCDMKPSNILLVKGGRLRLIDLGGAHICHGDDDRPVASALTKGFAAPEQYEGQATIASDIYGLGATLATICPSKAPKALKRIIAKCQNLKPKNRYKSIQVVAKALKLVHLQKRGIMGMWKICLTLLAVAFLWNNIGDILHEARSKAYVDAIAQTRYEAAIEIFPDESQPYLKILTQYKDGGKTTEGILKVENLLSIYASDELVKQQVHFAIGRLYFGGNIFDEEFGVDYEMADKYFAKVQKEVYAHIDWYQNMAKKLCDFGTEIDWQQLQRDLQTMEATCMAMASDEEKIATLYETAVVYLTNRYYLTDVKCDPIEESTRLLQMCKDLLLKNGALTIDDNIMNDINMSLARNCLLAGLQANDSESLEESYELYEAELQKQSPAEIRLEIMRKLAYIKRCQSDYQGATIWYEKAIAENETDIETYCQYTSMKLLEEQNVEAAKSLFAKASQLKDCENNKNYQTIKTRLEAIS